VSKKGSSYSVPAGKKRENASSSKKVHFNGWGYKKKKKPAGDRGGREGVPGRLHKSVRDEFEIWGSVKIEQQKRQASLSEGGRKKQRRHQFGAMRPHSTSPGKRKKTFPSVREQIRSSWGGPPKKEDPRANRLSR